MIELHNPIEAAQWLRTKVSGSLQTNSQNIKSGDGFVAWPGTSTDGRHYVNESLAKGASVCLVERNGIEAFDFKNSGNQVAVYKDLKKSTGSIASEYYGQPSKKIDVIAVTGTNGKTSTVWWLSQAITYVKSVSAKKCGVIGTLGVGASDPIKGHSNTNQLNQQGLEFNGLTTPDPVLLQKSFCDFHSAGFGACAIEASSIGLAEERLSGTAIKTAVFTNFTQDHLDYHNTMESYWKAKEKLFECPTLEVAVINVDDSKSQQLLAGLSGKSIDVWTTSTSSVARLTATGVQYTKNGIACVVNEESKSYSLQTSLAGTYNIANILGVLAVMRSIGIAMQDAIDVCQFLTPVPGRMNVIMQDGMPAIIVDYAHTPDALEKALVDSRKISKQSDGQLFCIFGCGGNRDSLKRPIMAEVAQKFSDRVVVTSDNSRDENIHDIFNDIKAGFKPSDDVIFEPDRSIAIRNIVLQASPCDVILIAGKGHELYQELMGKRHYFSDKEQALLALSQRGHQ
ncbi:MAG TPA: UDP-N-acetylmuramoyl-L-alanyl-D-glutamate--2,6-diaminopimelate ligase [Burkholderiaceae bacterium]|nr:UDP-N-acetylmuramoyl-L-alanyl-D-glutamate--2,6-diaminopimelate ligase [Burkholderiaceae bacterium]